MIELVELPNGSCPVEKLYRLRVNWALEYHTLILFFLKEALWNKSLYFFLPGYLKAQLKVA